MKRKNTCRALCLLLCALLCASLFPAAVWAEGEPETAEAEAPGEEAPEIPAEEAPDGTGTPEDPEGAGEPEGTEGDKPAGDGEGTPEEPEETAPGENPEEPGQDAEAAGEPEEELLLAAENSTLTTVTVTAGEAGALLRLGSGKEAARLAVTAEGDTLRDVIAALHAQYGSPEDCAFGEDGALLLFWGRTPGLR